MINVTQDIYSLNMMFLNLVRTVASENALLAIWLFDINQKDLAKIQQMPLEDLQRYAASLRALFTLAPPKKDSIEPSIAAALMPSNQQSVPDTIFGEDHEGSR